LSTSSRARATAWSRSSWIRAAPARSAARSGDLADELIDRELSILRTLPGSATQR
jgi:hypothetical protein